MAQQTAVEWLVEKLYEQGHFYYVQQTELIDQAKQMEKEQIKVSYGVGHNDGCAYTTNNKPDFEDQEQYYNETFGNK